MQGSADNAKIAVSSFITFILAILFNALIKQNVKEDDIMGNKVNIFIHSILEGLGCLGINIASDALLAKAL